MPSGACDVRRGDPKCSSLASALSRLRQFRFA